MCLWHLCKGLVLGANRMGGMPIGTLKRNAISFFSIFYSVTLRSRYPFWQHILNKRKMKMNESEPLWCQCECTHLLSHQFNFKWKWKYIQTVHSAQHSLAHMIWLIHWPGRLLWPICCYHVYFTGDILFGCHDSVGQFYVYLILDFVWWFIWCCCVSNGIELR